MANGQPQGVYNLHSTLKLVKGSKYIANTLTTTMIPYPLSNVHQCIHIQKQSLKIAQCTQN